MGNLFLRVFTVSLAVSVLLLPLLLCRGRLERRYAPQTRWWLWLTMALVLLAAPWLPKPQAPVVVEAPVYTVSLPVRPAAGPQSPVNVPVQGGAKAPQAVLPEGQVPAGAGQGQAAAGSAQSAAQNGAAVPSQSQTGAVQAAGLSLLLLAAGVWLLGVAAVLLWQGGRYVWLRRRLLAASRPVSGLEGYARELGLEGRVAFYECEGVSGPMTLGLFRPAVLLPAEGVAPAALRHELYHIKRRDVGYKTLLLLSCALHWFNPLVWRMARAAGRDVEACCDAAVVAGRDSGYKRSYGELLLTSAAEPQTLPFTTSFGGGAEQMKARLTQLFRPGKRSRALVCVLLAAAVLLSGLVACREKTGTLADGVYCSPYANVVWPVGEEDAEGEDPASIRLSLLEYSETEGPHGKPLGEYTLPFHPFLRLRMSGWGEDRSAGDMGTEEWRQAVADLLSWPTRRNSISLGTDYLVVEVVNGQVFRLSWAMVSRNDALYVNGTYGFTLQLPEDWAGRYFVREEEGVVWFFQQSGEGEDGKPLFRVAIDPVSILDPFRSENDPSGHAGVVSDLAEVLGQNDEFLFRIIHEPELKWYDENDHSTQAVEYREMSQQAWGLGAGDFDFITEPSEGRVLTENTMPHLDFYDPETQFLVYHTQTGLYFNYGGSEAQERFRQEAFRCNRNEGERVMAAVDVRYHDGEVWFSDCATDGSEIRYYTYDIAEHTIREQDGPFDPEPGLLAPADPKRIFEQGQYQPSHTYSLWSNALVCADGTLAALAVNGILEGGGTLDALEIVRMGEIWWEENRLLTPERLSAPADYVSPDWGFVIHLPQNMAGRYLVARNYNVDGLPGWTFYDKESYAGPNGTGFLFSVFAQDAETYRGRGEAGIVLGEKDGIIYTKTVWLQREEGYSAGYTELLDAVESVNGETFDLSACFRSTGYLWPVPGTGQTQDVVLRMFGQDGLDGVRLLIPNGGWPRSVAAGTVSAVRQEPGSGFYTVSVDHGNGIVTSYGHLSHVWVSEGSELLRGDGLGLVGESDGQCALLFAWNENGRYINPVNDVEWRREDFSVVDPVDLLYAGDPHIPSALRSVLLGETTFYDVERGEYCYVSALPFSDDVAVKVSRFTRVDMDNDAIPEVVLWLERGGNENVLGSIVLHYQNGWVYGYPMGYRSLELEGLKTDGTYNWSEGAFHWGWGRLDFAAGKTRNISWCEASGEEELYYVEQLPATAAEFETAYAAQNAKENATWLELTEENIALVY